MEDRQSRNNVHFVGFPEGVEGTQPEDFLELWLKDNMEEVTVSRPFAIQTYPSTCHSQQTTEHVTQGQLLCQRFY